MQLPPVNFAGCVVGVIAVCRYAGFLLPYLYQAVQGGAADERWAQSHAAKQGYLLLILALISLNQKF